MAAPRKFDHDEARRLYEAGGWTLEQLADRFGVTDSAIHFVVNDEAQARLKERVREWQRAGVCERCGGQCTRPGYPRHRRKDRVVCKDCAVEVDTAARQATRLDGDGRVHCERCDEHRGRAEFRTDRRGYPVPRCRPCETESRREYRHAHPEIVERENAKRREKLRRQRGAAR